MATINWWSVVLASVYYWLYTFGSEEVQKVDMLQWPIPVIILAYNTARPTGNQRRTTRNNTKYQERIARSTGRY